MRQLFETQRSRKNFLCFSVLVALCFYCSITIPGQQPKTKTANPPNEDTRLAQQQELIGRLVGIVNELKSEADKPAAALLQSEVADVLWRFDEPAARSIFRLAFDTARQEITGKPSGISSGPESPTKIAAANLRPQSSSKEIRVSRSERRGRVVAGV